MDLLEPLGPGPVAPPRRTLLPHLQPRKDRGDGCQEPDQVRLHGDQLQLPGARSEMPTAAAALGNWTVSRAGYGIVRSSMS